MSNDTVIASLKEKIDDLNQQAWDVRVRDSPKSLVLSKEAVDLARSIDYAKGLAEGLQNCGLGYIRLSKNDEAVTVLKEALPLFKSLNDLKGQAMVYEYLGIVERNWGNLGGSLEILFKALALTEQIKIKEIEASSNYQIAVTYKHLGDFEKALDYLYQAIAAAREMNNSLFEAYAINVIGSIYFETGDYKQALDYYLQALVARQEAGDKWGEAGSLDNIGFTYLKLQDYLQAVEYCKKSLEITRSTGDKKGQANTLLHLAEIYKQSNNAIQAAKFCNESLQIRQASGDKRGEAEILLFLADLHRDQPENGKNVLECLNNSLKIAEEIKAVDLLSKTRFHLYEYYKQKGDFEAALKNLDLHTNLEKEFHKNSINQKVSNLEISHKAETISQRNKELTELNEKIEKANEELKVEASLERVRAVAMGMKEPGDMLHVCRMISDQLLQLGFKEIRNVQTVIIYPQKHEHLNYQYFTPYDKDLIETIDYRLHPDVLNFTNQMLASADAYYSKTFEGKELKAWREYRKQTNQLPDPKLDATASLHHYFYSIGSGALGVTTYAPLSDEQINLFKRFRNVFDLAYRRFIDIEKALAQAREAQIEAALERVRAKSMAMHHSDDLITVINIVHEQLLGLGFHFHGANFVTDYSEKGYTMWLASPGESFPYKIYVPQIGLKYFEAVNAAIEKGSDFATYTLNFEEKNIYFKNLFENSLARNTSEEAKRIVYESKGMTASVVLLDKVRLNLMNLDLIPFTDEENNILKRFGYVFEQSYTRFLDLQKAEAQAREAQIEAALERVRSKTMAMQRSEELDSVIKTVYSELKHLDVSFDRCFIMIFDEQKGATWWMGSPEDDLFHEGFYVQYHSHPPHLAYLKGWEERQQKWEYWLGGQIKKDWDEFIFNKTGLSKLPSIAIQYMKSFDSAHLAASFENFGCMTTGGQERLSEESFSILSRFAKVFEQTYTRFLDLQKAEAQAREAQIEAALERVRSRSLAMHQSSELEEVIMVVSEQLQQLQFRFHNVSFVRYNEKKGLNFWLASPGRQQPFLLEVPYLDNPVFNRPLEAFKNGVDFIADILTPEENHEWLKHLIKHSGLKIFSDEDKKNLLNTTSYARSLVLMRHIILVIGNFAAVPYTEEQNLVLKRFANVFDQAYTRFLDLQKAEAQAKEAKIEAALERVRSRSMAMHKSDELREVVAVLFAQLQHLGFDIKFCSIALIDKINSTVEFWLSGFSQEILPESYHVPNLDHPFYRNFQNVFQKGIPYHVFELDGEEKKSYDKLWFTLTDFKNLPEPVKKPMMEMERVVLSCAFTKNGMIQIGGFEPLSDTDASIVQRFAKVFEQTHTRFLDLQKAEAQAREAQIEAALERVRAKVMAMTNSKELNATSLVFGEQLRKLNIDWQFSYFWLVDESKNENVFWITWPDYKTSFTSYTMAEAEEYFNDCLVSWRAGVKIHDNYVPPEGVQEWLNTFQRIADDAGGKAKEIMVFDTFANGVFYYDAMMKYGSFGICISKPATDEEKNIQCRFAVEFERAYTRFLDLKTAEAHAEQARLDLIQIQTEKKRAEDALTELQLTQKQLIQTEKMASLGELTAGIAHEIQNPLNFVNNFSDVSNELLEEMKQELATGNTEQAIEIVNDVKENLKKILHHGKRADAIVKSMLQHSRSSAGKKEPTDINSLAEEYFRLAYHGLRAKDKSFNAKFETDLDKSIGKINIISQDVGRVILNLINNAFYAVNEKKSRNTNGYEPIVTISTKKVDDKVEVKVKDNGDGIPQKVLDKIFQPFFTTKPTGQGTGLGLSLSYDIITKGHGGELKVETKEGVGSEFIISLPVN